MEIHLFVTLELFAALDTLRLLMTVAVWKHKATYRSTSSSYSLINLRPTKAAIVLLSDESAEIIKISDRIWTLLLMTTLDADHFFLSCVQVRIWFE